MDWGEHMDMRKEISAFSSLERALISFSYWRPALRNKVREDSVNWYSTVGGKDVGSVDDDV